MLETKARRGLPFLNTDVSHETDTPANCTSTAVETDVAEEASLVTHPVSSDMEPTMVLRFKDKIKTKGRPKRKNRQLTFNKRHLTGWKQRKTEKGNDRQQITANVP